MARIRSVKPELRRDLTVAEWPREVRYAWVLLWGYLDDEGRGHDDMRLLVADLFPLDRDVTEKKLDGWLRLMASENHYGAPPLCRYTVSGRRYLHAPKWVRSQRVSHPLKSTIPSCPMHESEQSESGSVPDRLPNDSGVDPDEFGTSHAPEVLGVKGAREQGSKGCADAPTSSSPGGFDEWWSAYPRKTAKGTAIKAYRAALRRATASELLAGVHRYADDPTRKSADPAFTKHPATWLNGDCWLDEGPALPVKANTDAQGRQCPPGQESLPVYERYRRVTL